MSNNSSGPLDQILTAIQSVQMEIAGLRADLKGSSNENEFVENVPPVSSAAAGQGLAARLGLGASTKQKKERVPGVSREPSTWRLFTDRVRSLLADHGYNRKASGVEIIQFASSLKQEESDLSAWSDEEILARRATWTPPSVSKGKAGGRRTLRKRKQ